MNVPKDNTVLPKVPKLKGKKATFLLGTDCHIGEGNRDEVEKRVGVTPRQVEKLRTWLEDCGISLDFYFVQGAGIRAGYTDGDYLNQGGQLVFEHQLPGLPAPDVFHALKEPAAYESFLPGPFIRIGALHTGAFDSNSGLACLIRSKNFSAIFDGSNVGGYSFRTTGGPPVPIRSSMSRFAGQIAADQAGERFKAKKSYKIVIFGGGVAGYSAVTQLLEGYVDRCGEIRVIEKQETTCRILQQKLTQDNVKIIHRGTIEKEDLHKADVLILTAFRPGHPAPKVLGLEQLKLINNKATIVDVAIDETGCIEVPGVNFDKASLAHVIVGVRKAIDGLKKDIHYVADSHMPRKRPGKASVAHGEAILPYIAVLLYLAAEKGNVHSAVQYISKLSTHRKTENLFELLLYDLKTGLAFFRPDPLMISQKVVGGVMNKFEDFLKHQGVELKPYDPNPPN